MLQGYDPGDENLTSEHLGRKYPGDTLKQKSNAFVGLSFEKQRERLYSVITGEEKGKHKDVAVEIFIITNVRFFLGELKKIEKMDEWISRTIPYLEFLKLPIEEKKKYHNALIKFHDKCKGQPESKRFLASSPTVTEEGCPDFDNKNKWEEIK